MKRKPTSLRTRSRLIILFFLFIPALAAVFAFSLMERKDFEMYLFGHLTLCSLFLPFLPKWLTNFFVDSELREMNNYCVELRNGNWDARLPVGGEVDKEDSEREQLPELRQNLNWLAHNIASRDRRLTQALASSKKDNIQLNKLSFMDHLSGVYNRRFYEVKLEEICRKHLENNKPLHLVLIDCDHFKKINDSLGHATGDKIIAILGNILKNSVRMEEDYPFRFGGDEFGCIFCGASSRRCVEIAEDIRCLFTTRTEFVPKIQLSLSIGISSLCKEERNPATAAEKLFANADRALYEAKNGGRNRVVFFNN